MRQTVDYSPRSASPSSATAGVAVGVAMIVVAVVVVDGLPFLVASDRRPGSWAGMLAELGVTTFGLVWNVVLTILLCLLSPVLQRMTGTKHIIVFLIPAVVLPFIGFGLDYLALRQGWFR